MSFEEILRGAQLESYGESYKSHVLEIYRTYLEMADRISARREATNSFFLTINTALTGLIGYLGATAPESATLDRRVPMAIAGIAISYLWYRIVRSYRDLNSAKFKVVHEIEKLLPLRPYDAEWEAVGRGKDRARYLPFTHVEIVVPWVFAALHLFVVLSAIPWQRAFCRLSAAG